MGGRGSRRLGSRLSPILVPMDISLNWLNRYLSPAGLTAAEADQILTHAGFPIEETREMPGGDVFLDVEVTSNRGDCLSHIGLAREVATCTDRALKIPEISDPATASGSVGDLLGLENTTPQVCSLFTARVIRGCKVGPSPAWLVELLEAIGQRSINNVVDVTNFITFELGNPCHVFDLSKLAGGKLIIRWAKAGELLTTLDGKDRKLKADELVVADAQRAQSLAGVIGGADSEVDESTVDVVLEMATWDPVTVRTASRRHQVRTDASFRFERIVDPRTIDSAARRAAALICELTGGQLCEGVLSEGPELPETTTVSLRPSRCRDLIGIDISDDEMGDLLRGLEIGVEPGPDGSLTCTIPPHRTDLYREIDLVEEVVRTKGFDHIPIQDRLNLIVPHPQESERAVREIGSILTGLGFYETVTFSFVGRKRAKEFLREGLKTVEVDDDRRKAEPTLRPSVLPSLLTCRKANQDGQVSVPGGIRLFEMSAVFAEDAQGQSSEHRALAMLIDVPGAGKKRSFDDKQAGVRQMRGVVETIVRAMAGPNAKVDFEPGSAPIAAYDAQACAQVMLDGAALGWSGLISAAELGAADIEVPVVAAELDLDSLVSRFPTMNAIEALPAYPGIERDLSLVVDEQVTWSQVALLTQSAKLELCEGFAFVGAYRGKQVGPGKKSLTMRLKFRDSSRTLRHEEVDPQVQTLVAAAKDRLEATLRD